MLNYFKNTIGFVSGKIKTSDEEIQFKYQIRQGNCLGVMINTRQATEKEIKESPEVKMYDELIMFYVNEQHLKNMVKDNVDLLPYGTNYIGLNLYYNEAKTLLKYFTRAGFVVECYYRKE